MSCAGLMQGTGYAAPSQQTSAESSANEGDEPASDRPHDDVSSPGASLRLDRRKASEGRIPSAEHQEHHHGSEQESPAQPCNLTAANRPKQLPISRKTFQTWKCHESSSAGFRQIRWCCKRRIHQERKANNALTVRPTSVARPPGIAQPIAQRAPSRSQPGGRWWIGKPGQQQYRGAQRNSYAPQALRNSLE
jgi:hypothetical protein